jgi:hypothetical protein
VAAESQELVLQSECVSTPISQPFTVLCITWERISPGSFAGIVDGCRGLRSPVVREIGFAEPDALALLSCKTPGFEGEDQRREPQKTPIGLMWVTVPAQTPPPGGA